MCSRISYVLQMYKGLRLMAHIIAVPNEIAGVLEKCAIMSMKHDGILNEKMYDMPLSSLELKITPEDA